jgi:hypothetical protein
MRNNQKAKNLPWQLYLKSGSDEVPKSACAPESGNRNEINRRRGMNALPPHLQVFLASLSCGLFDCEI